MLRERYGLRRVFGSNRLSVINKPTAARIVFSLVEKTSGQQNVLIYYVGVGCISLLVCWLCYPILSSGMVSLLVNVGHTVVLALSA